MSIEHSREWYEKVSGLLADHNLPVELILKEPMPLREEDGPWRFLPGQMTGVCGSTLGNI
ncbi:MAG: hypothetical protein QNL33_18140 [Akkermansiaceae bacterium]